MTSPQLCHCRLASQSASSSAVLCASSFAWTAAPVSGRTAAPASARIANAELLGVPSGGRHCPVQSVHALRDAADAVLQLLQHGGWGAGSRPASWVPRLLKGLLDTVPHFLQLQPKLVLNGAPSPQRAPINTRIRRLGGCGFGFRGRQLVPQGDPAHGWIHCLGGVARDASLTDPLGITERTSSSSGSSFVMAVHSRVSSRCISARTFVTYL